MNANDECRYWTVKRHHRERQPLSRNYHLWILKVCISTVNFL